MRLIRLSAALTILLASASCAQSSTAPGGETKPGNTSTALPLPSDLLPSGLPSAARPNEARPDSQVVDLKPTRWTSTDAVDGRTIQVHYTITGRGDCAALGRVDLAETPTTVTITVLLGRLPGAKCDGAQSQLAALMVTAVTLNQPLGNRAVHDGAAG